MPNCCGVRLLVSSNAFKLGQNRFSGDSSDALGSDEAKFGLIQHGHFGSAPPAPKPFHGLDSSAVKALPSAITENWAPAPSTNFCGFPCYFSEVPRSSLRDNFWIANYRPELSGLPRSDKFPYTPPMRQFIPIISRVLILVLAAAGSLFAQNDPEWTEPFPPFRIADNLYYVGSKGLANYLITTPQGNILINSDLEANVPLLQASIEKLGFKFKDTKILLEVVFSLF